MWFLYFFCLCYWGCVWCHYLNAGCFYFYFLKFKYCGLLILSLHFIFLYQKVIHCIFFFRFWFRSYILAFWIPRLILGECYLRVRLCEVLGFLKELESGFAVDFLFNNLIGMLRVEFFDGFTECGWIKSSEYYTGIWKCCFECEPVDSCTASCCLICLLDFCLCIVGFERKYSKLLV